MKVHVITGKLCRHNYAIVVLVLSWKAFIVQGGHAFRREGHGVCNWKSSTGGEMLLDRSTGLCHGFGTRGPCGESMIFYRHPLYSQYGFCDCDQGYRSDRQCSDHPVRRMIYVSNLGKCFPVFSQGPCNDGFWLNFEKFSDTPACVRNPCVNAVATKSLYNYDWKNISPQFIFFDPTRKTCFVSLKQGYCPHGLTLEMTHEHHIPQCRKVLCESALTNFRSHLTCKPGSRFSYFLRGCTKPVRAKYLKAIG